MPRLVNVGTTDHPVEIDLEAATIVSVSRDPNQPEVHLIVDGQPRGFVGETARKLIAEIEQMSRSSP